MCIIHITWSEKELLFLTSTAMQQTTQSQRTWTKGSVHKASWSGEPRGRLRFLHCVKQCQQYIIFDLRSQVAKIPSPKSNVSENMTPNWIPPKIKKEGYPISNLTKLQAGLCLAWHKSYEWPVENVKCKWWTHPNWGEEDSHTNPCCEETPCQLVISLFWILTAIYSTCKLMQVRKGISHHDMTLMMRTAPGHESISANYGFRPRMLCPFCAIPFPVPPEVSPHWV